MRMTAIPATTAEFASSGHRAVWDRELLYRSMVRWGQGAVVAATGRPFVSTYARRTLRTVSRAGDVSRWWRSSSHRRWLRDIAQVEPINVPAATEVLYGHIAFPQARPHRPVVWSTNGIVDARPGAWFPDQSARTHERFIRRAAAVQCWTEFGYRGLSERVPQRLLNRVTVVPPLVYVELPDPWERAGHEPVAIFIGAFGELKGLDVVLAVARRVPDVRVEVITASTRPDTLPDNVDWLGSRPREEVLARLRSAAVHLFPSTTESFGGVVVEALAAGVAQIVDAGSVTAEVLGPGGLAVDGRDVEHVATALDRLVRDTSFRASCAAAGRARFESTYAVDVVGPRVAALIESV